MRNEVIQEISFPPLVSLSSFRWRCVKQAPIRTISHQAMSRPGRSGILGVESHSVAVMGNVKAAG